MQITTIKELRKIYQQPKGRAVSKQLDYLDQHSLKFLKLSPFCILATFGKDGLADATPRGGKPGFIQNSDVKTLLIPDWPGNNRLDSLENIISNQGVGLLFLVPGIKETLRVNGSVQPPVFGPPFKLVSGDTFSAPSAVLPKVQEVDNSELNVV